MIRPFALSSAICVLLIGGAYAQQQQPGLSRPATSGQGITARPAPGQVEAKLSSESRDVMEMRPGAQTVVHLGGTFSSITVGDPEVADVLPRSDRVFVVNARKVGVTDITVFDNSVYIYKFTVSVGAAQQRAVVRAHGKGKLHEYYAYECNPICTRVKDDLEGPPPQTHTIQVLVPPPPPQ
jgi:hypothetical protein